jgi:hypothetical protein
LNDTNGDGISDAADFDYVLYNYNAGAAGYIGQDYLHLPRYGRGTTRFITIL